MMESLFVVAAVVGATELVKRAFQREWETFFKILAAVVVGIGAGYFGIEGLSIPGGLVAGLSASGAVTFGDRIGKKRR